MEIKTNHMVVITPKMNLLQIPIKDKYFVPPSHPAARARATEFAQEKGLLNPRQELLAKAAAASAKDKSAAVSAGQQQVQPQSSSSRRPPQTH